MNRMLSSWRSHHGCCTEFYLKLISTPLQVQIALHANQSENVVGWRWVFCDHGNPLQYQEEDLQISMLPLYDEILSLKSSENLAC